MGEGRRPTWAKAVPLGSSSAAWAASSSSVPEEASKRPRTQDTGKVSHFARNQPGGVRSSSASPPSPHSPCLTGILTVQRLFGGGFVDARSSLVQSGARRPGPRGRSLGDLTSRCSGRGRLRPSLVEGSGEPAPQLNVRYVRSTGLGSRATCREGLRRRQIRTRGTREEGTRLSPAYLSVIAHPDGHDSAWSW